MFSVILAVLAGINLGLSDFTGGLASKRNSALQVAMWVQWIGAISIIPALFIIESEFKSGDLLWSSLGGICLAGGLILLLHCLTLGNIARVSSVEIIIVSALPVLFGLVSGERPTKAVLIGIGIAFIAIPLASSKAVGELIGPSTGHWLRTHQGKLTLTAGGLLGLFLIFLSRGHDGAGMWPAFLTRVVSAVVILGIGLITKRNLDFPRHSVHITLASGFTAVIAVACFSVASQKGLTSVAAAFVSLIPIVVAILGRLVLKERLTRYQISGIALSAISISLITAGSI